MATLLQEIYLLRDGSITAGGPGSGCNGPNCGRPEGSTSHNLDSRGKRVEVKFRKELHSDWEGAKAEYSKRFGKVLAVDEAKELSKDYVKDKSLAAAVHEPASELVKDIYKDRLKDPSPPAMNSVVFTAGAPGAGKTSGISAVPELARMTDKAHLIYDGMFADPVSASKKIDQALNAGKDVHVMYVYRDPEEGFKNGILPRAIETGRIVPAGSAAESYSKVHDSISALIDRYGDHPNVSIHAIDNTRGLGSARVVPFNQLPVKNNDPDQLKQKFFDLVDDEYSKGKMSDKTYKAMRR